MDRCDAGYGGKNLRHTDVMKRFRCDKVDNNDDFIEMATANGSANGFSWRSVRGIRKNSFDDSR